MPKFILGLLVGVLLVTPQQDKTVLTATIVREGTKPTGDIMFWHFKGVGATCSADFDSPFGQAMRKWETEKEIKTVITMERFLLEEISR
jgi:hypothetical protein